MQRMSKRSDARNVLGPSIKLLLLPVEKALIEKAAAKEGSAAFPGRWARKALVDHATKVLGQA